MRVLIVEDDLKLAGLIQRALREQAALADAAHDGEDALWMADATPYDVMVLDVNLPGINGFETCQRLRASRVHIPILILTARAAVDDRVTGLDTGADDYLVKPFDISEMLARIRALARRGPAAREPVLTVGDLSLDAGTRVVRRGSTQIALSTKEFQLLEVFMRRPGQVLSRYDLLEGAWDMAYENRSNVVDVYVRYLRDKIDRPFGIRTIETVRGAGYRLSASTRHSLRPRRPIRQRPAGGERGKHGLTSAAAAHAGARDRRAQSTIRDARVIPGLIPSPGGQMAATISAREQLLCAVSDAPDRSQRQDAEEWQLVSEASHELRTPLTALRTEVELALLRNRDARELQAALRSAADEIRRVCRLADDILMLARADHGQLPLRLQPLEPRVLLEAAAARAGATAWTRGRQIVVRDMAPRRWLVGDPDRAAQALDNLVSNALQYGTGTITLTARDDGKLLGLHVADQGSGFAEDVAARAFQRFTRGKRARDPGSGLGLSLVAAIAIAHRGVATVCNLPEGGADACIALPQWFPGELWAWRATWPGDAGAGPIGAMSPRTPTQSRPTGPARPQFGSGRSRTSVPCRRPARNRRCRPGHRPTAGLTSPSR